MSGTLYFQAQANNGLTVGCSGFFFVTLTGRMWLFVITARLGRDGCQAVRSAREKSGAAHLPLGGGNGCQFLTSKRRTADQGPELPPLFARTRHHIRCTGNVLVLN